MASEALAHLLVARSVYRGRLRRRGCARDGASGLCQLYILDNELNGNYEPLQRVCIASPTIRIRNKRTTIRGQLRHVSGLQRPNVRTADLPAIVANCANLTPFSHRGDLLARNILRLYFFSNRSCCPWLSSLKFGGHTLRALYGLALSLANGTCLGSESLPDCASRLTVAENIVHLVCRGSE